MTIWEEAKQSVRGSIRVFKLDQDALQDFNLTDSGFWRSFYAAAYLLPIYLVFMSIAPRAKGVSEGKFWLIEAINYPLSWTLWPLVVFYICRGAGVLDKYAAYITVYNWAQIVLSGGRMVLIIVALSLFPLALTGNIILITLVAVLAAEALIIRLVLGIPWPQAIMIELLALVLALVLGAVKHFVMIGGG